jgi:hypothetical protein
MDVERGAGPDPRPNEPEEGFRKGIDIVNLEPPPPRDSPPSDDPPPPTGSD